MNRFQIGRSIRLSGCGWYNDSFRHSLAARGISTTSARHSFYMKVPQRQDQPQLQEPLISKEELMDRVIHGKDPITSNLQKSRFLMTDDDMYAAGEIQNRGTARWTFAKKENDEAKAVSSAFLVPQKPDPKKEEKYVENLKNGDPVDAMRLESYVAGEALAENISNLSGFTIGYKDQKGDSNEKQRSVY